MEMAKIQCYKMAKSVFWPYFAHFSIFFAEIWTQNVFLDSLFMERKTFNIFGIFGKLWLKFDFSKLSKNRDKTAREAKL